MSLNSASSATIVRFPYLYTLTDINEFLYSTTDVAIWSTIETGLGITAAAVATLRPLLRSFFGGSSAPGNGTSAAQQWPKSANGHPRSGYFRSKGTGDGEGFDLQSNVGNKTGVTTVIRHKDDADDFDMERAQYKADDGSDASTSATRLDDWNSSQSNLADRNEQRRKESAWNITVKKTVVQSRAEDA